MKQRVRTVLVLFLFLIGWVQAQSITLQPPSGYDNSSSIPKIIVKLFFAPTDSLILNSGTTIPASAKFVVGSSTGNYNLGEIALDPGTKRWAFKPGSAPLNLSTGRYYGLITNAAERTLAGIQASANSSATVKYSNEVQFVVEAQNAPSATEPRSNITTSTPTFKWNAIPGVTAYWIIVSSTPFTVKTVNGNPQVQGANIVWDYLATGTSAGYGQISPSSPFTQSAIPLFAGSTYYYTILNLYDQNDVAYASTVFGGIVSFTYQSQAQITAPVLINPADAQVFNATPTIRFQWDAVPSANSYTVYLFNRVTSFAGSTQEIDLPIWNGSTTNTQIDFAARQNLLKGKYVWFVVPNTATGSGTASATRSFNYNVTLGKFRLYLSPTNGTTNLVNFSLQINSTTGGYSPSVPMIISNSEIAADSIPVDVYQFTAKKPGFSDTTYTLTLSPTTQLVQVLKIRPFPSTVTGKVKDQAGAAVKDATIQFLDILTNVTKSFTSSTSGDFSVNLPQSSYKVTVSKPGYLSPAVRTYTVEMGQLDITGSPFVLTLDKVTVSGTTINDEGLPVQLATVKATKGTVIQEVTTNATGIYSFELSSGSWTIEAAKSGFVSPNPVNMNLATGGSVSGQNIVLVPRANQVNGIIYKVSQSGASSSLIPASGVTVTATPVSGPVISGVTGSSGQYQLSLKSGTYTISSQLQGYTPNSNPQITLGVGQTITGIDINLNPNPSSVSGIITTTSGAVLGDAVVKAGSISATSLPTGNYQLSLSAGTHTLTVTKAGYVTPGTVTVTLTPGQQLGGINFSLNPNASTITGSVVSLGQPLTNATVSAQQGSNTPVVTTTGNTGEFVLSVVPGNWKLVASKQGFIVPAGTPVDSFFVGAGQTSANHVFSLVENTATIKGAISASGAGLNGAAILIKDINNSSLTYASLTDINGEYSLNVPAGTSYSLTASLTGYSTYNANIANLVARDIRINNGILTALPASIAGKVSNNLSQPLNEVKVYLVDNTTNVAIDSTVTDVTGAYILGTFAGTYKVRATLRGYTVDEDVISVGLGQALNNANLTINANFALVSGTILDGSTPLAGVVVSLSSSQGGGTATTATDGTYSILQLVGDVYSLSVTKQGYADIQQTGLTINGGENKTLNFSMDKLSGSVSGVVKTTAGELVADATISLTSGNNSFSAVTSAAGQYSINNLAFGTYDVSSVKTGYTSPAVSQVTLVLGNSTITKDISGMVLNNSRISGKITDATEVALGNAVVKISGSAGSASANSDFSGNYELASLADGTYEIFISKAGYVTLNDVVTLAGSAIKSVQLLAANTTIPGTVKSAAGPLGFPVSVSIISGGVTQSATTDAQGAFSFSNMSSNAQYTLATNIFKEGYSNTDATFFVPKGVSSIDPVNLIVKISKSKVRGGVKTSSASVAVVDTATKQTYNTTSSSTGAFSIENLAAAVYKVTPRKAGFTFSPDSRTLTLGQEATSDSLVFEATQNVGSMKVTVTLSGSPEKGVRVSAVSSDNNDQYFGETDATGIVTFNDVTANKDYVVSAVKSGFTSSPVQNTVRVNTGAQATQTFTITANTSRLEGKVVNKRTGGGQANVPVVFRNSSSGQLIKITNSVGEFIFDSLAAGAATLSTSLQGFESTPVAVTVAGAVTTASITVTPAYVGLSGKVLFGTTPIKGVFVTATSSSVFVDTTDANGIYSFSNLPVNVKSSDTTIYKVSISGTDVASQTKSVRIDTAKVTSNITVPNFVLPSGTINITVTNGVVGLQGATVSFIKPDGAASQKVTDKDGKISTFEKLSSGIYKLNIAIDEYLIPDTTLLKIALAESQALPVTIPLRYKFTPLVSIDASKDTKFDLKYFVLTPTTATLHVKQGASGTYQQYTMALSTTDSTYTKTIPALNKTDEVSYFITANATSAGIVYTSPVHTIKPEASGILSSIAFSPSLNGITVRKSDTYEFNLVTRDGKNVSLNASFQGATPAGTLKLEGIDSTAFEVTYPKTNDLTLVRVKVLATAKDGNYRLSAVGNLKGNLVRQPADFIVGQVVLKEVLVNSGITELSNKSKGYQFSYSGIDTSKKSVTLGTGLTWSVTPSGAGSIDSTGLYKPADTTFIGTITVTASDKISNKKGSTDVKVYADIDKNSNVILTDKMGMTLAIVPNSVAIPIRVTLDKQQFGPGKKYYVSGDMSYIVQNTQYPIAYDADQALPNNKLTNPAVLIIPVDNSLALFEGNRTMGFYNFDQNQWSLVPGSAPSGAGSLKANITEFGEYSVLAENEDLGISKLSVLPSPFSPEVAPLKIGFKLSSKQGNASVNIRIFNLRGELVRHLMRSEQLPSEIYGSGAKSIHWDGKTDDGKTALNGRYIIQVSAEDPTGTVNKLIQVVLVK